MSNIDKYPFPGIKMVDRPLEFNNPTYFDSLKCKVVDATRFDSSPAERESVKVLRECIELQNKKGSDYQSKESRVRQADYYVHGVETIHDIMHAKMLRLVSVMEKIKAGGSTQFESLEDSAKDLINYASFFVAYSRGKIDGQSPDNDIFNREAK